MLNFIKNKINIINIIIIILFVIINSYFLRFAVLIEDDLIEPLFYSNLPEYINWLKVSYYGNYIVGLLPKIIVGTIPEFFNIHVIDWLNYFVTPFKSFLITIIIYKIISIFYLKSKKKFLFP